MTTRPLDVLDKAKERGVTIKDTFDSALLREKQEIKLIKTLAKFPDVVRTAGEKSEPQILADYLRDLAADFHIFYHDCRIIGNEENLQNARLHLIMMTRTAMRNGLAILGISAPERM